MTNFKDKPLFSLTVGELINVINPIMKRGQEQIADALEKLSVSKPPDQDEILNIDQAADLLGLTKGTIYQKVHDQSLKYFKAPGGKMLKFKRSELLAWLNENDHRKDSRL